MIAFTPNLNYGRHVCGLCQSPLEFNGAYNADGTVSHIEYSDPSLIEFIAKEN